MTTSAPSRAWPVSRRALPSYITACVALLLVARAASADPPAPTGPAHPPAAAAGPKVCVAVGGDPDSVVVEAASRLHDALAARADVRSVADADARAVLRGESRTEPSLAALSTARRALSGDDTDAAQLDAIGQRLGCAVAVELRALPSGVMLRTYDVVHHTFHGRAEVTTVDASVIDSLVLPAAQATRAAPASAGSNSAAPTPAPTPTSTTGASSAPAPGGAALAGARGSATATAPSATITGPSVTAALSLPAAATSSTAGTRPFVEHATAPAPGVVAPRGVIARPGLAAGQTPASNQRGRTPARPTNRGIPIAAWVVAGGAAVALIAGFIIAEAVTPGNPVIQVVHPAPTGASP